DGGAAVLKAAGVDVEVGVLADEAQVVLGPWLAATRRRRPWVVWLSSALAGTCDPADLDTVRELRQEADVVISSDGRILEGIPGGHGTGRFHHPPRIDFADPIASLNQIFEGGTRTALVVGDTPFTRALLALGAIDQALIDVPRSNSEINGASHVQGNLTHGFRIEMVTTTADAVRIVARPDAPGDGILRG